MINRRRAMVGGREFDIVSIIPRTIPNTYIETNGVEKAYNGWCSTDFIPVSRFSFYMINHTYTQGMKYGAFYDINKNFVVACSNTGYGDIPSNAVYLRFSHPDYINSNVFFSKNAISSGVYMEGMYISDENGSIIPYSSYAVYKFDILDEVYVVSSTCNQYNASYYSDGSLLECGKGFYHKPFSGYVLASRPKVDSVFFVYGKHFLSIQQ